MLGQARNMTSWATSSASLRLPSSRSTVRRSLFTAPIGRYSQPHHATPSSNR